MARNRFVSGNLGQWQDCAPSNGMRMCKQSCWTCQIYIHCNEYDHHQVICLFRTRSSYFCSSDGCQTSPCHNIPYHQKVIWYTQLLRIIHDTLDTQIIRSYLLNKAHHNERVGIRFWFLSKDSNQKSTQNLPLLVFVKITNVLHHKFENYMIRRMHVWLDIKWKGVNAEGLRQRHKCIQH